MNVKSYSFQIDQNDIWSFGDIFSSSHRELGEHHCCLMKSVWQFPCVSNIHVDCHIEIQSRFTVLE